MKFLISPLLAVMMFLGCTQHEKKKTTLYYNYYEQDKLKKENALIVEYDSNDTASFVSVKFDSSNFAFIEKVNSAGLFRGLIDSILQVTHSFTIGEKIESNIGKEAPPIINTWATAIQVKKIIVNKADSMDVIFYDEGIPAWSFTSTYYSKSENLFLVYFNQQKDAYYKLVNAEGGGVKNKEAILELTDNITKDTTFFGKFNKLPMVKAPQLNDSF